MDSSPETLWIDARRAHAEGRFQDSLSLSQRILKLRPGEPQAQLMAGISSAKLARTQEALDYLLALVRIHPRAYPGHLWLSIVLNGAGRPEEAFEHAQKAAQMEPRDPEVQNALGACHITRGEYHDARQCFERAIATNPANPNYHFGLSIAYERLAHLPEALKAMRRAVKVAPNPAWLFRLGLLEAISGNVDRGRELAEKLGQVSQDSADYHHLIGRVLQEEGHEEEAESHYLQAVELDPEREVVHALLGMRFQSQGRFGEAIESFRRSMELQPNQGSAYYGIATSKTIDPTDQELIDRMEETALSGRLQSDEQAMIEFALGKAYHDRRDPKLAMAHYDEANRLSALVSFHGRAFDRDGFAREVDEAIRVFTKDFIRSQPPGSESESPVFIVGMIRSGTTLMEHILSCHPQIGAAGEQAFWATKERQIVDYSRGSSDIGKLQASSNEYLRILEAYGNGKPRVTDKNPANVMCLGLIHVAFPNAKIIHMLRHPVDTFLSIWMTAIRNPPPFACDKANIVHAYREYMRLTEHWRSVLPSRSYLEIRYEDLVSNQEAVTRAVLEHLGLPWNEACSVPEKNPRVVQTPSLWQVRQPIHTGSVKKWKLYEPWLGPFAEFLPGADAP